ncbi:MAG: lamin tail domain-containing protein [Ignavibacteriales bacterium]|nr:lamin tail domain-containing protein [Ignavibacteriales bacterium]
MQLRAILFLLFIQTTCSIAQITASQYSENFDGVTAPILPYGWSGNGFSTYASSPHSAPNCVSATGNRSIKTLLSPVFNFGSRFPNTLVFWERRTSTAAAYRLEIRASVDGINFGILLARFDTITTITSYVQRTIDLSKKGLNFQSNVQLKWIVLADSTNNTGVLRIDDVSISVTTGSDVGFSKISAAPVHATRKDSIILSAVVKNYGLLASSNFSIRLFCDENSNGLYESIEQFTALHGLSLSPGDSSTCLVSHAPMKAGDHNFAAVIDYSSDENHSNDTARTIVSVGNVKCDILVNEIMYYPIGDELEWVEVFNTSSDTINVKNWRISDSNISAKSIITQTDVLLPPSSYLVIAKDIVFRSYHSGISVVTTSFSALNNSTPDAVVIYDSRLSTIDSVMYAPSWGGQNGKSLERIDGELSSTVLTNWGTSQDSLGSTPGKKNSIARLDCDLMISNVTQTQTTVGGKIHPIVHASVHNIGRRIVDSVLVRYYADGHRDSTPELMRTILSAQPLAAGDSILFSESFPQLASGTTNIIVVVDWWRDERLQNNRTSITVNIRYEPRSLIINEIMYDPLYGQNEWIELFNRSGQPIDLAGWSFNDNPTLNNVNSFDISSQPFAVESGGNAIVAADSSLFRLFPNLLQSDSLVHIRILNRLSGLSFNNDGDIVVLKDLTGQAIDSVAYLPRWHHPDVVDTRGRSLERINPNIDSNDPRNWSTCTNILGGTPGKANSIVTTSIPSSSMISISPNPFSPDGDGFEDFCIIRYNLPVMTSTVNLRIYDIKGRLIRTLANGELAGAHGEIVWDGFCNDKQRARIGIYIIFLESTDHSSGRVERAKAVAVVATRL